MTPLTRIRNRAGLLVGIIAFALFAFVLGDLFRSGSSIFGDDPRLLGEIAGKKVMIGEFEARFDKAVEQEKQRSQKASLDEATLDQLRQQTWNQLIYETIMEGEHASLGITVSSEELFDMVQGKNPHPSVVQAFTDPKTGQFNPQAVVTFLKRMDEDQTGETKQRWLAFEKAMKTERVAGKFTNLVKGGLFVTKAQAKRDYNETNRTAKVKLVMQRFGEIPDSTVKVTDADLSNWYNQNKNRFKQDQSVRGVEYVMFEAVPSEEDRAAAMKDVEKIKEELMVTKEDTAFLEANSDSPLNINFYAKGSLGGILDSLMFANAPGFVYGPYNEGNMLKLAKLLDIKNLPDSVKARHILIKIQNGNKAAAKSKADSLKDLVSKGMKFDQLAMMFSEDEGSKIKGGDLGWFKEGMMVAPFNNACFQGNKGDMPIVESQFGYHLIEILDKGKETKRVKVGFIDREQRPSSKTFQKFYSQASEFAGKNNDAAKFDKAIIDMGLNKRIAENIKEVDRNIPGVEGARELVKWAYKAKKDEISPVFEFSGKYIIAKLNVIKDKGTLPLEAVKPEVEMQAKKEKKAEMLIKKMQDASSGASSIEQIAAKLNGKVEPVENITFAAGFIPGMGREPELNALPFNLTKGKISAPVKGDNGVFVVVVEEIKEPAPTTDYKTQLTNIGQQLKQRVDYEMFEALKEKANVVDNRIKFF